MLALSAAVIINVKALSNAPSSMSDIPYYPQCQQLRRLSKKADVAQQHCSRVEEADEAHLCDCNELGGGGDGRGRPAKTPSNGVALPRVVDLNKAPALITREHKT